MPLPRPDDGVPYGEMFHGYAAPYGQTNDYRPSNGPNGSSVTYKDAVWSSPQNSFGIWDGSNSRIPGGNGKGGMVQGQWAGEWDGDASPGAFAAQVRAAAAAAIEQPTFFQDRSPNRAHWQGANMNSMIANAQQEAERRRNGGYSGIQQAQSNAANLRGQQDISEMIKHAQLRSAQSRQGGVSSDIGENYGPNRKAALEAAGFQKARGQKPGQGLQQPLTPQDFLGSWVDMQGNSVVVHSVDAYEMRLVAIVSQPFARKDKSLKLFCTADGSWICGNATLDPSLSSKGEIHWIGPNGKYSVWHQGRA